jgi:pSer/pThr/pTyr-binding forkhead associated (FHA) protein
MTLFHSKKQPNESADNGQKPRKRGVGYCLEIRCRGKLIQTLLLDDPDKNLTIGRAADNDLAIPEDDRSCGDHHAKLHIVQNGVKLTACERNRIHFRGESVSSTVLKKNDRASIGDSEIFVKSTSEAALAPCDVHRLETHGGEQNGEMIRLEKSPFRIGSAADNDLVLKSDVVSKYHAEIRIAENGETWLRDMGSSNGTFVNGERLKRQERMLMDLDEISVACFDYAFLDRNIVHTRTHFGKKILILIFTLFLAAGIFGLYYMMSPKTETVINVIDYYLRQNNYGAAKRVLNKMPDSKGFQRYKKQYRDYASSIQNYENTYNALLSFRNDLKEGQWNNAAESFGELELEDPEAWNQADPQTPIIQHQVQEEKKLLDTQLSLRNMATSLDTTVDELKEKWKEMQPLQKRLKEEMDAEPMVVPDYMHPLYQAILHQLSDLENDCGLLQKIESKLNVLSDSGNPTQITDLVNFLTNDDSDISGIIKVYKRDLLNRMKIIRDNLESLDENDQALFDLRLDDLHIVRLISSDDCVMIPQLYKFREHMEDRLLAQFRGRDQWQGLLESLAVYRLEPGRIPEEIAVFSNEALLERVFSLADLVSSGNQAVSAEYEKLFGERYFYEVLQQTVHSANNLYASDLLPDIQYIPQCIHLKDMYRKVSEALFWCNLPQNEWMMHGKLQETKEYYQAIMDTRKNVLNACENIAARYKNNRQYFLAKTAYFFFAPFGPEIPGQMQAFGEEWRKFRLEQQNYIYSYDPMDESKAAQIKAYVIRNGIPGDPLFNWVRSLD